MESKLNNTIQFLQAEQSFIGKNEVVNGYLNIVCNLFTTKDCVITCEQSMNGTDYQFSEQFAHNVSVFGTQSRTQFFVKAYYGRISVFNATLDDIPKVVLTTIFTNTNHDSSSEQPSIITGDVVVTNPMKARDYITNAVLELSCDANGIIKTDTNVTNIALSPIGNGVSVYGSSDGTDRLLLATTDAGILKTDTNVTIENIELTPAHDGVSVYGSSNGTDRLLLATTDAGILKTDTNVTIENIQLTPEHDGVTMYGKTDIGAYAPIKTDLLGVVSVTDPDAHIQLAELNTTLNKINVNMNANTNLKVSASNISSSAGGTISPVVDLGTGENRDRNIVFYGEADVAIPANANPKLIMKFSEDLQGDYFSDGEYASFYKKVALNSWEFCFQRSNCPLRYVQLYTETDAKLITLKCVTSKN